MKGKFGLKANKLSNIFWKNNFGFIEVNPTYACRLAYPALSILIIINLTICCQYFYGVRKGKSEIITESARRLIDW